MSDVPLQLLVIEDSPSDIAQLRKLFGEAAAAHFSLMIASSMLEADSLVGKALYQAILLDLTLPDRVGLEAVTYLQNEIPSVPLIVLCEPEDESLAVKAVQAGAHDYLVKKHLSTELLVRSIRYAIERHRLMSELRAASLVDELTGLHNRQGFMKLAQQQLKIAMRTRRGMLLLMVGLDGMKYINDRFGRYQGDLTLSEASTVLKKTFRGSDIIARYDSDEFTVLAIETSGASGALFINRLQENLEAYNMRESRPYRLSFTAGLAHFDPEHPCTIEGLLEQAQRMMLEQKKSRRLVSENEARS